ncbi:MAG: hypothetical protein AABX17_03805 [Nanoarchaeota archaeon]
MAEQYSRWEKFVGWYNRRCYIATGLPKPTDPEDASVESFARDYHNKRLEARVSQRHSRLGFPKGW